jgi:hypothetical protein
LSRWARAAQGTRRYGSEEAPPIDWIVRPGSGDTPGQMTSPGLSEMFAYHATTMANTIKTSLVVFSRKARARAARALGRRLCSHGLQTSASAAECLCALCLMSS